MNSLEKMYDRAEKEIEFIEQDESLSNEEKGEAIKEIRAEVRDLEREYRNNDEQY
jgi:uncharacterized membrane protein YukC